MSTTVEQISQAEADSLKTTYQDVINGTSFTGSIKDQFQFTPVGDSIQNLAAFCVNLEDYVRITSYVGATNFNVSFGMTSAQPDTASDVPSFCLLVQAYNEDRTVRGPIYKLKKPISVADARSWRKDRLSVLGGVLDQGPNHLFEELQKTEPKLKEVVPAIPSALMALFGLNWITDQAVPRPLHWNWVISWENLFSTTPSTNMPPYICMISTFINDVKVSQVLNGYNFGLEDFVTVLDPVIGKLGKDGSDYNFDFSDYDVHFYLVNHNHINDQPQVDSGLIGLAVASVLKIDGVPALLSTFNDFSAPCPPTCPT